MKNQSISIFLWFISASLFCVFSCNFLSPVSDIEIQANVELTIAAIHAQTEKSLVNVQQISTFTRVPVVENQVGISNTDFDVPSIITVIPTTPFPPEVVIPECLGALPTRISIGKNIQVTTSGKVPRLGIRPQPTLDASKMFELLSGEVMKVLDGPVCANNSYFWFVDTPKGEGWVREGNQEFYFVDPLP